MHVLDRRIVPNGRRDEFEVNAHYANLINQLSPVGRDIARRCRTSSTLRSKLREFDSAHEDACERLSVVAQGAMSAAAQASEFNRIGQMIARMRKILDVDGVDADALEVMSSRIADVETELERLSDGTPIDPLGMLAEAERETYRQVLGLIYECSANRVAAKSLVDRIIQRLAA